MALARWIALLGGCLLACVASTLWSVRYWRRWIRDDTRTYDDSVGDIRAMNTYNSYFLAAIVIFLGVTQDQPLFGGVPSVSLVLMAAALLSAAVALFYIPSKKPAHEGAPTNVKRIWLAKLLPTQWTVILAVSGVLSSVVVRV